MIETYIFYYVHVLTDYMTIMKTLNITDDIKGYIQRTSIGKELLRGSDDVAILKHALLRSGINGDEIVFKQCIDAIPQEQLSQYLVTPDSGSNISLLGSIISMGKVKIFEMLIEDKKIPIETMNEILTERDVQFLSIYKKREIVARFLTQYSQYKLKDIEKSSVAKETTETIIPVIPSAPAIDIEHELVEAVCDIALRFKNKTNVSADVMAEVLHEELVGRGVVDKGSEIILDDLEPHCRGFLLHPQNSLEKIVIAVQELIDSIKVVLNIEVNIEQSRIDLLAKDIKKAIDKDTDEQELEQPQTHSARLEQERSNPTSTSLLRG